MELSNQIAGRLFVRGIFGIARLFGNWLLKRLFPLKLEDIQCKIEGMAQMQIRLNSMTEFSTRIEVDNRTHYDLVPTRCTIFATVAGRNLAVYDLTLFEEWRAGQKLFLDLYRPVDSTLAQTFSNGNSGATQSLHLRIILVFLTQLGLRKLEVQMNGNVSVHGP